jgi:hypothetical protein
VRRKQPEHQRQYQKAAELHQAVRAQITVAARLREIPIHYSSDADEDERRKQVQTPFRVDALCDDGPDQRHEANSHRQAVPNQRLVVRMEVIPRRAEGSERHSGEKCEVGPSLARIEEARPPFGRIAERANHSRQAHQKEERVGNNVEAIGNAKESTVVREVVIGLTLRNGREEKHDNDRESDPGQEDPNSPVHRYGLPKRSSALRRRKQSRIERRTKDICSARAGWPPKRAD